MNRTWYSLCMVAIIALPTIPSNALQTSTRTEEKTVEISLDSTSNDPVTQIDLSEYNIPMPAECADANVSCIESTNVHMKITKQWEITTVYELTDSRLTPEEYSLYYPDIQEQGPIGRNSTPEEILLLQRALYERGLLGVLPTGRYGALTELAVMHFNQIKEIDACNQNPVNASIVTIAALNKMKARMANPHYLTTTNPPPFNVTTLCPTAKNRFTDLVTFTDAAKRGEIVQTLTNVSGTAVEITVNGSGPSRSALQLDGFVKIER